MYLNLSEKKSLCLTLVKFSIPTQRSGKPIITGNNIKTSVVSFNVVLPTRASRWVIKSLKIHDFSLRFSKGVTECFAVMGWDPGQIGVLGSALIHDPDCR